MWLVGCGDAWKMALGGSEEETVMKTKRDVPQGVFDSEDAQRAARRGHSEAVKALQAAWDRGDAVGDGDPNHPMYNGGVDPRMLFGRKQGVHMALQNRAV